MDGLQPPFNWALYVHRFMSSWIKKVDFAFLAEDQESSVSLVYVEHKNIPDIVRNIYTENTYNQLTEFIIDEIEGINSEWPKSDLSRGFYVHEYSSSEGSFKKLGDPVIPIKAEKLSRFRSHIISIKNISFKESNELTF